MVAVGLVAEGVRISTPAEVVAEFEVEIVVLEVEAEVVVLEVTWGC